MGGTFGKRLILLGLQQNFAFWHENRTFADLKAVTALEFISVAGSKDDVLPDPGLENYGRQPMPEFYRLMSQARFMVRVSASALLSQNRTG